MLLYERDPDCCQILPPKGKLILSKGEVVIPLKEMPQREAITIHISMAAVKELEL